MQINGSFIKDCSACDYPHRPENYARIIHYLTEIKLNWMNDIIRRDEEKYRTFFEESRDALVITSREGNIIECNKSALLLLGYTKEETMRLNAERLYVYHDDRKRFQQRIEGEGYVKDYGVKLLKRDGTHMDCLLTFSLLHERNGAISGYQGIIRESRELRERPKGASISRFRLNRELPGEWGIFRRIYG